jgi:ribose transport system ATP-binding protein
MVGDGIAIASRSASIRRPAMKVVLEVRDLSSSSLRGVELALRSGEVVGVAGIDGSGREQLAPALFGGAPRAGAVLIGGQPLPDSRPDLAVSHGVGLVPADRESEAAFVGMSVADNLTAPRIRTRLRRLLLDRRGERAEAGSWIERLAIRPPSPEASIETLSGGNQQKVLIARWLRVSPRVLIFDEPTKGVDVSAVTTIWSLIAEAAESGTALLICSSESEELAANCDRILVLRGGRIVGEARGGEVTGEEIDALALGAEETPT